MYCKLAQTQANGHYRKGKAEKGFHLANFITALPPFILSSSFSPLYLLSIPPVMGVKVGRLSGPPDSQALHQH